MRTNSRVGQQLGNYRLVRWLAKGGYAEVYLGEHIYLKTQAAIKVLLEHLEGGDEKDFRAAFLQEAQKIANLKHPHILRVLEFGIAAASPFLVLEYAAHGSLEQRHPPGTKVPLTQVVSYTKQIAQALQYAHDARLIHRDVKPANVLLDERDTLLLSDFGIAAIAHHNIVSISTLSSMGGPGTPAYMPPEQINGLPPATASDQYALAVMIYRWLCGQLPYQGDNPLSLAMQHLSAPIPSLHVHNASLAPQVESVVQKALAKDPNQRFATVLEFADALEQASRPKSLFLSPFPSQQPAPAGWEQVQSEEERRLFLLATFFPEADPIPIWLVGLAAGLREREGLTFSATPFEATCEGACRHLQELGLFAAIQDEQVRLTSQMRAFGQRFIQQSGREGELLEEEAGQRLLKACTSLSWLEGRTRQTSYYACEKQVRAIREYLELLGLKEHSAQAAQVERWLARESYLLTDTHYWPNKLPDLFCQQLYNRSVEGGSPLILDKKPVRWLRQTRQAGADDPALMRIFADSTGGVNSMAISPDGHHVLTVSDDKTAHLWELDSGRELLRLEGHTAEVDSVAFSLDGRHALTGSRDKTARLWDLYSGRGRELLCLEGHTDWVLAVTLSSDGRHALTGSRDETACLWDLHSGRVLQRLSYTRRVDGVVFSPDGQQFLTGTMLGVILWDVQSGRELLRLGDGWTRSMAFSPDGQRVLTRASDGTRLWDVQSGRQLLLLTSDGGWANGVAFSPDGYQALTGLNDDMVCLWDLHSGRELLRLTGHTGKVSSVAFSPDKQQALTSAYSGDGVRFWDLSSKRRPPQASGHTGKVNSVAFSPDGRHALTASSDKTARLWEVDSGRELLCLEGNAAWRSSIAFSPNGRYALVGGEGGEQLWDLQSGHKLLQLKAYGGGGTHNVAISPNGQLALAGSPSEMYLWDLNSGSELFRRECDGRNVWSVAFSSDGRQALAGTRSGIVYLWEVPSGRELLQFGERKRLDLYSPIIDDVNSVAFSPNGLHALTSSADKTACLWDLRSGHKLLQLDHTSWVKNATFSPDGNLAITCDHNGRVFFYRAQEPERGKLLGIYVATYQVGALYWQDATHVVLADIGGPQGSPHFYHLTLEGVFDRTSSQVISENVGARRRRSP